MKSSIFKGLFLLLVGFQSAQAQEIDETYNSKIREFTTDPRFLPQSVLNVEKHPEIPSPLEHFGEIIGAPKIMHSTAEIYEYYKILADKSPFLSIRQVETSEEGRPIFLVIIGDEDSNQRLDHYQSQMNKLADPRITDAAQAKDIIADTKPFYYLNGGMHSTEMGSPEMLMELAYRMVSSSDPAIVNIRENLILLINPVSEPDGRDKQVDWYHRYTKEISEWENDFPKSPPYWGKYVFHDNNRDGLQVSQAITKGIFKIFFDWHPIVMLDLHESVPLLYISTGTGPYNEQVDPITIGEWQIMANSDIASLAAQGMPGAFTWAFYDGWWPGYGIWVANNHNSNGRFYETFGNAGANTYLRDLSKQSYAGDPATTREWYRPDPPTEKVYWSARNNVNYMQAGVLASLTYAAHNGEQLLKNFYQKGVNSIQKGKSESPKAFIIPSGQKDPVMAAYLVNQLRAQRIEVHQATEGENEGDYVVLLDQPYRNLAVNLLTEQNYPKDAKFPPYDDIAWTLGYLYGVKVEKTDSLVYESNQLKLLNEDAKYTGKTVGNGNGYFLNYQAQNTVLPALYWMKEQNKNFEALILEEEFIVGNDTLAKGSIYFEGINSSLAKSLNENYGLDLIRGSEKPQSDQGHKMNLPRIAIYHTWFNTQDEGWSRYTFEQRGIPYTSIDKDDLKNGNLRANFDVILVPRSRGNASTFIHGVTTEFGPIAYTKTEEYSSHGFPDSSEDITGGPGFMGMDNLKKFAEDGGMIITLDNSTAMVAETGITRKLSPYSASGLFHPGSVVTVKAKNSSSPLLYGYPEIFSIFRGNGPLYQVDLKNRDMMVLQYGTKGLKDETPYDGPIMGMPDKKKEETKEQESTEKSPPYVRSGMVRNEQNIIGHGTLFNVPVGKGRIIAFTFDPLHRYLNHHDAPLVWNALINWDDMD
ncbi:Zinc carboxypeptidase [Algoriphagus hitonicola]|uniref:Zinc carboxypeptidase n=2 Tax=Algoriphagus hitonicola TaxID=435880 RepID=A0A1I2VW32_9BACT|nr:M14 family zinc carboxypeptidase [Algoriphagus hitonicola]SFG91501.1 Zinc carboxypeptidase [Algoriphagus hitonicola]